MRKVLMAFAVAAVAAPAIAADAGDPGSYACVAEHAIGFRLGKDGKWAPSQFGVQGKKYLLEKKGARWGWTEVGPPDPKPEACDASPDGFTECNYSEGRVLFNSKSLRFQLVRPYGYVTSDLATDKDMRAPPYYIIGKCSAQ